MVVVGERAFLHVNEGGGGSTEVTSAFDGLHCRNHINIDVLGSLRVSGLMHIASIRIYRQHSCTMNWSHRYPNLLRLGLSASRQDKSTPSFSEIRKCVPSSIEL
jgi:hypothetical protein